MIGQRHIYDRHHPLECVWSSNWRDNTPRIGEPHALVQDPYTKSWAHDLVCDCPVGGVIRGHIANIEARRAFVTEFASDSHHHPTPTPLKPLEPSPEYPKGGSTPQYIARSLTFSPIVCDTPTPAAIPFQYPQELPESTVQLLKVANIIRTIEEEYPGGIPRQAHTTEEPRSYFEIPIGHAQVPGYWENPQIPVPPKDTRTSRATAIARVQEATRARQKKRQEQCPLLYPTRRGTVSDTGIARQPCPDTTNIAQGREQETERIPAPSPRPDP